MLSLKHQNARALADGDSFATTLLTILFDRYGGELIEWHPMTITMEVNDDYRVLLPRKNLDKVMTGIYLLTSDDFYKRLPRFIQVCNILAGDTFDPLQFDWADSFECAWGITEAGLIEPPEDNQQEPFDEEILAYIGAVLREDGIARPPDVLRIARTDYDAEGALEAFSSDPVLYESAWAVQDAKSQEVKDMLTRNIRLLVSQLEGLSLSHGRPTEVLQKMRAAV